MTACLVLIDELSHTRRTPELMLDNQQEHTLEEWYRYGVQTLTAYAVDGPFMSTYITFFRIRNRTLISRWY